MTIENRPAKTSERRAFLRTSLNLLGVSVALVLPLQAKTRAAAPEIADSPSPAPKGYRESEHVRTYYEKARF
ncbi:MAG: formate dehydrogenase [Gammaproteobacteria bacterium]